MKIEQIYTGCIAHSAYYLESNGEAAIFDPLREVQPYIEKAQKDGASIKYIFETHFHADFVSGHLDLAKKTGATIVYGPTAKPQFEAVIATDNQEFKVGLYTVRAIHTPGHTMESTSYLLIDENGKEYGLISGDTLFIGDVGRPDLAQHVISELTPELLASHLYDSLRNKIMPLSDDIIVYPNHGAGSACGKNMSKETTDTLGNQKRTNYALNPSLSREEFTKQLLDGQRNPPAYFPENVLLNIRGYDSIDTVMKRGLKPLTISAFETLANETDALLLDTRDPEIFSQAFIPNSINIGIDGSFAMWAGALIPGVKHPILLITEAGKEEETITRLARVGYDNVLGYLQGSFDAWQQSGKEIDRASRITAKELESMMESKPIIIDVRNETEFDAEHINGAINVPLDYLNYNLNSFPKEQPFIIHCAGGYRSMIAASILKARGWENFADVKGGFKAIAETSVPKTNFVCQSTKASV
ncbi:beta-lactamase [Bacteroidetes bacterium UKL13-3]|jgi:glyoxylase-like metal-dependent hydrolase (beta-lactamase superfamily II)/rhodanese-related sulfurtransferase|nr:beta-lactamase [Bacteroidetes bacterium UKL13-3]HCP94854.1 MBL fold metallo-hydrolase [Bacteroidota bacterium]